MAGRRLEYVSSPECSPLRLTGPQCAVLPRLPVVQHSAGHGHADRSPAVHWCSRDQVSTVSDVDDDDRDQQPLSEEGEHSQICHPRPAPQLGKAKRRRMQCSERDLSAAEILRQLNVVEQVTSGFANNCLWFSTQLAMGMLTGAASSTLVQQSRPVRWAMKRSTQS